MPVDIRDDIARPFTGAVQVGSQDGIEHGHFNGSPGTMAGDIKHADSPEDIRTVQSRPSPGITQVNNVVIVAATNTGRIANGILQAFYTVCRMWQQFFLGRLHFLQIALVTRLLGRQCDLQFTVGQYLL